MKSVTFHSSIWKPREVNDLPGPPPFNHEGDLGSFCRVGSEAERLT